MAAPEVPHPAVEDPTADLKGWWCTMADRNRSAIFALCGVKVVVRQVGLSLLIRFQRWLSIGRLLLGALIAWVDKIPQRDDPLRIPASQLDTNRVQRNELGCEGEGMPCLSSLHTAAAELQVLVLHNLLTCISTYTVSVYL